MLFTLGTIIMVSRQGEGLVRVVACFGDRVQREQRTDWEVRFKALIFFCLVCYIADFQICWMNVEMFVFTRYRQYLPALKTLCNTCLRAEFYRR